MGDSKPREIKIATSIYYALTRFQSHVKSCSCSVTIKPPPTQRQKSYYDPHGMDEEIEAQRGEDTCLG